MRLAWVLKPWPMSSGRLRRLPGDEPICPRGLADLLESLPDGWDTPSLCAGWRVRAVVAHMTVPIRYSTDLSLLISGRDVAGWISEDVE